MRLTRTDAAVHLIGVAAAILSALGPISRGTIAHAVGAYLLVVAAEWLVRDVVPPAARLLCAGSLAGAALWLADTIPARAFLALGLAAAALALPRTQPHVEESAWASLWIFAAVEFLSPAVGLVGCAALALTTRLNIFQVILAILIAGARWPWTPMDAIPPMSLVLIAAVLSRAMRAPLRRAPLREGAQRAVLFFAALAPGCAALGGLVVGLDLAQLGLVAVAGAWLGIAIVGASVVLATVSPLRVNLGGLAIVPGIAAALDDPVALSALIIPATACFGVGITALARAFLRERGNAGQGAAAWTPGAGPAHDPQTTGRSEVQIGPATKVP